MRTLQEIRNNPAVPSTRLFDEDYKEYCSETPEAEQMTYEEYEEEAINDEKFNMSIIKGWD